MVTMSGEIKLVLDKLTIAMVVPSYCLLLATAFMVTVFGVISLAVNVGWVKL